MLWHARFSVGTAVASANTIAVRHQSSPRSALIPKHSWPRIAILDFLVSHPSHHSPPWPLSGHHDHHGHDYGPWPPETCCLSPWSSPLPVAHSRERWLQWLDIWRTPRYDRHGPCPWRRTSFHRSHGPGQSAQRQRAGRHLLDYWVDSGLGQWRAAKWLGKVAEHVSNIQQHKWTSSIINWQQENAEKTHLYRWSWMNAPRRQPPATCPIMVAGQGTAARWTNAWRASWDTNGPFATSVCKCFDLCHLRAWHCECEANAQYMCGERLEESNGKQTYLHKTTTTEWNLLHARLTHCEAGYSHQTQTRLS